ncbi:Plasma kallikrein [Toxocara canis]|uniref:Plasma kallikrein n=1 Tax=Toxocara canis TaxID=6265 RepID=A0A0B2VQC9_TOXCA|nr:Plasma kallikrein [Toxocara canis]
MWRCTVVSLVVLFSLESYDANANRRIRRLSEEEYKELERTCGRHVQSVKKRAAQEWPEPAVSEGIPANKDEFPWALKMATLVGNYGSEMCTAQVISKWHVVAAAHCLEFTNKGVRDVNVATKISLYGGSYCITSDDLHIERKLNCSRRDPPKSRRLRVKSFVITESSVHYVIHGMCGEKAAASLPHSDLVILELESPLNISDPSIRPICLASPLQEIPHQNRIYGFGATESAEKNHAENIELHWLFDGEVMSEEQCQVNFPYNGCDRVIATTHTKSTKRSVCKGDSGGGLSAVVNKRHTLFGILSKSYGYCSHLDEPWREFFELASKVSAFHDFFCYHTGICSLGYDVYLDFTYPFDPERYVVVEKGLGDSSLLNVEDGVCVNGQMMSRSSCASLNSIFIASTTFFLSFCIFPVWLKL